MRAIAVTGSALFAAACWFVFFRARHNGSANASDIYGYFLPNMLNVVRALGEGGRGLLWNPYQSCGEPVLANPVVGLFYPLHLLFLAFEANLAVHLVLLLNMMIGGLGMFLLARTVGVSRGAALGGALAFELGDPMLQLTAWSPMHNGPWAWVPWVLLGVERLLRRPPTRTALCGLVAALALQLLPGFVLIAALTWQLVLVRVVWALLVPEGPRPWRGAATIGAALALAPLAVAAQLLPTIELASESARASLALAQYLRFHPAQLLDAIAQRKPPVPFLVATLALACLAAGQRRHRSLAILLLCIAAASAVLGLGAATPLYSLYAAVPPGGATLRAPHRLFWVTGFALSWLAVLGLDTLWRGAVTRAMWLCVAPLAAGLWWATPGGLRPNEVVILSAILAAAALAARAPTLAGSVALVALVANLTGAPLLWPGRLLAALPAYEEFAPALAGLHPPIAAQDRITVRPSLGLLVQQRLMMKSGTLLRIREFSNYEALLSRRFLDFQSMANTGATLHETLAPQYAAAAARPRRRLADLAAIRYTVLARGAPTPADLVPLPVASREIQVASSPTALPRARWVPRVEVVADPDALLRRLADGADDLERVAFLEAPPPSGNLGAAAAGGTARLTRDDPERIEIEVDAPQPGFLILADQFYPGWEASVDARPAPVLRANYLFRAVEVPAGRSHVVWRFRPRSVWIGAALSLATAVALAALLATRGRNEGVGAGRSDGE